MSLRDASAVVWIGLVTRFDGQPEQPQRPNLTAPHSLSPSSEPHGGFVDWQQELTAGEDSQQVASAWQQLATV